MKVHDLGGKSLPLAALSMIQPPRSGIRLYLRAPVPILLICIDQRDRQRHGRW